jgi:ATP-dependent DNA ligase
MEAFARLYCELDRTTSTGGKLAALQHYFRTADEEDAAWATYFLAGGKPRRPVRTSVLRAFAVDACALPQWLFDECYHVVGDFAETVSLLLPPPAAVTHAGLALWMRERILPLRQLPPEAVVARLTVWLGELDASGRFLLFKLLGGGFRVGVSRLLVTRALAEIAGVDGKVVAQRLIGYTAIDRAPTGDDFRALVSAVVEGEPLRGQPYPFFLAHPLQVPVATLGDVRDWLVEWKWDGIRAQLVRRGARTYLWSRGEELVTERFPSSSPSVTRCRKAR